LAACWKLRIRAVGVGPPISSWLSRMVTAPVDAVMCAAVPGPPTQPPKPQPWPSRKTG
jgi:hypothetical protein